VKTINIGAGHCAGLASGLGALPAIALVAAPLTSAVVNF